MKTRKKITDNHAFFVDFALFWVIFGWLAFVCSLLDFFYASVFIGYAILAGGYFALTLALRRRILRFSIDFVFANILIFLAVFVFSLFVTPTVFTGRDQGAISNAAINLAQNNGLGFSNTASREFFSIYGQGKALNFPGFHYTNEGSLMTQFPLGYISWLGAFYSVFGINGLIIANTVCLFTFLMSLYIIGKKLLKIRYSALLILFLLTSFSFAWFFKFTLSENLALMLLWTMILSILYMKKSPDKKSFALYALTATLLVFTRIEGYAFLITSLFVILRDRNIREFIFVHKKTIGVFIAFFLGAFAINFSRNMPFFIEIGKVLRNFLPGYQDIKDTKQTSVIAAGMRMLQIHTLYGLTLFLAFGTLGILRSFAEKSKLILIPFIVASPSIIYIIDSNISSDHPWLLRRFAFAVLPLFIFYTAYLLKVMFEKNPDSARHPVFTRYIASIIVILILFINLKSFTRYAFYSEDQRLLEQTKQLSEKFSEKDLILVDRLANDNGWSMITGPMRTLFDRQAVYLINTSDLSKIDLNKFENIYLITPTTNLTRYAASDIGSRLNIAEKYSLQTTKLVEKKSSSILPFIQYPEKEEIETEGYILKFEK